jgi:hypothetical protein
MLFYLFLLCSEFFDDSVFNSPFEKGGRGDLKISTVATILNPPHSPFFKGGG